jgi:hypothetical protein
MQMIVATVTNVKLYFLQGKELVSAPSAKTSATVLLVSRLGTHCCPWKTVHENALSAGDTVIAMLASAVLAQKESAWN